MKITHTKDCIIKEQVKNIDFVTLKINKKEYIKMQQDFDEFMSDFHDWDNAQFM
jgi:hypothetical protein